MSKFFAKFGKRTAAALLAALVVFASACEEIQKPKPETFYADTAPPKKREFRWSNGSLPKSLDPAKASAAPETDIVRAIFDGLTETDSRTLRAVPAIAKEWSHDEDLKVWTFKLRTDAKWSNGENITADDFVRSWLRLRDLKTPAHRGLLKNIVGFAQEEKVPTAAEISAAAPLENAFQSSNSNTQTNSNIAANVAVANVSSNSNANSNANIPVKEKPEKKEVLGVEAVADDVVRVTLRFPDKDFAEVVAHPIFRPVYDGDDALEESKIRADVITSGAFKITSVSPDGITLDRNDKYWNKNEITLERVQMVAINNAETALEAYRQGSLDAVTNFQFEPLALKLLSPYLDFRRTAHGALNFFDINTKNPALADVRVREALSGAIERERLTDDETDGAMFPARRFLPFENKEKLELSENAAVAKNKLADAGFSAENPLPKLRVVVNRNDLQQRIAKSVAKMWKQTLGIDTEIIALDADAFKKASDSGDYDVIRRGTVLPTASDASNMILLLGIHRDILPETKQQTTEPHEPKPESTIPALEVTAHSDIASELPHIPTEQEAIQDLTAIPLYFPTSYSLVKPYIDGFETNAIDAPSLKQVKINDDWKPTKK